MTAESRKKWLIAAAACTVGLFVADRFLLTPLATLWHDRSERIGDMREQLAKNESLAERGPELEVRWNEMIAASLPASRAEAEGLVLGAVNDWASSAGLEMAGIKPRWHSDDGPPTLECATSCTGTMGQLAQFLYALETGNIALRVEEISLSAEDERGATLRMDLRFTGIILQEHLL